MLLMSWKRNGSNLDIEIRSHAPAAQVFYTLITLGDSFHLPGETILTDIDRKIKHSPRMILSAVLSVAVLTLAGCGNEKSVTFDSAGMTHTFTEGKEGIPKDFQQLIYPGAAIAGSTSAQDKDGEHAAFISLSTADSVERVASWYAATLPKTGWSIDSQDSTQPAFVSIAGHQKDVEIAVLIAQDGDKITISISEGKSGEGDAVDEEQIENFTPNSVTPPTE